MGIFSMLDDECNFPKGTDETFLGKLMESHKGHSHLKPGGSSSDPHLKDNLSAPQKTTMGGVRGRMLTIGTHSQKCPLSRPCRVAVLGR